MTDTTIRVSKEVRQRLAVYATMNDESQGEAIERLLDIADAPVLSESE